MKLKNFRNNILSKSYIRSIALYVVYLVLSFISISLSWSYLALGRYFVCTDPTPIADFFPPFVHSVRMGDYFVQGQLVAYDIWHYLVAGIFLLPLISLFVHTQKHLRMSKAIALHILISISYAILVLSALWKIIIVTLLAIPIGIAAFAIYWFKKKLNIPLLAIYSLCVIVSLAIIVHGWSQSTSTPPEPLFPLDDPQATYFIQKLGNSYAVIYTKPGREDEYAFVGNSGVELEQYRGYPVIIGSNYTHSSEHYPYGNKYSNIQCIQHVCHEIFPPHFGESVSTAVIDINDIEMRK